MQNKLYWFLFNIKYPYLKYKKSFNTFKIKKGYLMIHRDIGNLRYGCHIHWRGFFKRPLICVKDLFNVLTANTKNINNKIYAKN